MWVVACINRCEKDKWNIVYIHVVTNIYQITNIYLPVTRLVPVFKIGKNSNSSKLSQSGENPLNLIWFERLPASTDFVAMPISGFCLLFAPILPFQLA